MSEPRKTLNNGFQVYKHHDLTRVTEEQLSADPGQVLSNADQGIQTAILSADGKTIRSIVGLNGTRYLPDPDPDPLDEILGLALEAAEGKTK